jgi:hypothetical protein
VAARKHKKNSWVKRLAFYVGFPLVVWFGAFLIWFYWNDLWALFGKDKTPMRAMPKASRGEKSEEAPANRPQEKILDEDRKRLEDILRRK